MGELRRRSQRLDRRGPHSLTSNDSHISQNSREQKTHSPPSFLKPIAVRSSSPAPLRKLIIHPTAAL